ncbi:MAG: hypothetical protein LBT97_05905 [Planctomycetota bacterium]|jgi:hypothetical protein|nr:hypothetical protein [Planctomycetota bacterium]
MRHAFAWLLVVAVFARGGGAQAATPFRLGLNADNWSGQTDSAQFRESVRELGVEFIVWHVHPVEIDTGHIQKAIEFCRRDGLGYLFNTEVVNYLPPEARFAADGGKTYRWDLGASLLNQVKDDPLFLGVVYDEPLLMQSLAGAVVFNRPVPPYFADTNKMTPEKAFDAVAGRIDELSAHYRQYNARMVLETLLPDASFVGARGGAVLAVKLLKENYLDLMTMMAAGAARQYLPENEKKGRGLELWACVDLWYLDTFPNAEMHGTTGKNGGHAPELLRQALEYAYNAGFDAAYIEMNKGLMDAAWKLTGHGTAAAAFDRWRKARPERTADWRTPPPAAFTVRRFPSGNPGGKLPDFLNLSAYGSGSYRFRDCRPSAGTGYCGKDQAWFKWFAAHAKNVGPVAPEAFAGTTFNSGAESPGSALERIGRPYQPLAGLPVIDFVDHTAPPLPAGKKDQVDFYGDGK